ncbi:MAG: YggT family protein [Pyrinomonadaceae bacterium]|jgi:YggT family protein|nr:YggT family protein [Pyrinomonadaceae bacterium]
MMIINLISVLVWYLIVSAIVGIILLVLARVIVNYADINPFSRTAITIRQFSDPLVNPVRRILLSYGLDQKLAPFVTILIAILLGWLLLELVGSVVFTVSGVITSLQGGALVSLVGYVLFGVLAVYSLLIVARIILAWGVSYGNRTMRFLVGVTEPILGPFRRLIPTMGMFDVSPMVVLLILQLFQRAIAGTLIG